MRSSQQLVASRPDQKRQHASRADGQRRSRSSGRWIPPIYVLSLKEVSRHKALTEKLVDHGIPFEIVWGIDGREQLPGHYEDQIDRRKARALIGRDMSDGEFACALSHKIISRKIAESDAPCAIVLEDDAVLGQEFFEALPELASVACDLLLLDHRNTRVWPWKKIHISEKVSAYQIALPPFLANGYLLSRQGAVQLSLEAGPVCHPADWPPSIMALRSYACMPRLVDHPPKSPDTSSLEVARRKTYRKRQSAKRFMEARYWMRWLRKRFSRKIG